MNEENPYSAPQADLDSQAAFDYENSNVIRSGKVLIAEDGTVFPGCCASCNRTATKVIRADLPKEMRGTRVPAYLILLAIAIGITPLLLVALDFDLPLGWIDELPIFFFPIVMGAVGLWMAWDNRNRRSKSKFFLCHMHFWMRRICSVITYSMITILFGLLLFSDFVGFDFVDYLFEKRIYLVFVGLTVVVAYIPVWFHLRVNGQPTNDGWLKFSGFGKQYLHSFREAEESEP